MRPIRKGVSRGALKPFFLFLILAGQVVHGTLAPPLWREGVPVAELRGALASPALTLEDRARVQLLLMKRLYENKAGMVDQLSQVGAVKEAVANLRAQAPGSVRSLALHAEMLQYVPGFLGGSLDRAQAEYEKALALGEDAETLYKAAVFHLNSRYLAGDGKEGRPHLERAALLLDRATRAVRPREPSEGEMFVWRWAPYQWAVVEKSKGEFEKARTHLITHFERCPDSVWGPYLSWTLLRGNGQATGPWGNAVETLERCRKTALSQGDRVMLDRLEKEARAGR